MVFKLYWVIVVCLTAISSAYARNIVTVNQNELSAEKSDDKENFQTTRLVQMGSRNNLETNTAREFSTPAEIADFNNTTRTHEKLGKKSKKEEENIWFHCADETTPSRVTVEPGNRMGVMCSKELHTASKKF